MQRNRGPELEATVKMGVSWGDYLKGLELGDSNQP